MEGSGPQLWHLITITWISSVVASAAAAYTLGSRSTRTSKPPKSQTTSSPAPSEIASLQADQASLFSTLEKLTTTVKRLSSRQGMREVRARQGELPIGTPKAELLRHYGMSGKVGPAFAQAQLELERSRTPSQE